MGDTTSRPVTFNFSHSGSQQPVDEIFYYEGKKLLGKSKVWND